MFRWGADFLSFFSPPLRPFSQLVIGLQSPRCFLFFVPAESVPSFSSHVLSAPDPTPLLISSLLSFPGVFRHQSNLLSHFDFRGLSIPPGVRDF